MHPVLMGEGRLRRETVEGFPLFVERRGPSRRRAALYLSDIGSIFISRASLLHSAISACTNFVKSSGELATATRPSAASDFTASGFFRLSAIAWYMRAMMASGTFAGASIPVHAPLS